MAGFLALCSTVQAQGEHSRRAAAELRVITGDIKRLQNPSTSELHRIGLKQRVLSGFAALDILMRYADQERGKPPKHYATEVAELRKNIIDSNLNDVQLRLQSWLTRYPLITEKFMFLETIDPAQGEKLHTEFCAACHDKPVTNTERPAYNLFDEAKNLPLQEFLARMIIGVRGDRVTGIDNPLSDYEIAALLKFYLSNS